MSSRLFLPVSQGPQHCELDSLKKPHYKRSCRLTSPDDYKSGARAVLGCHSLLNLTYVLVTARGLLDHIVLADR